MNLPILFAWRYLRSKKSTTAINIISWISMVAIAVGTAALIVVLSVFNGFEGLVKGLYSDFYPDVRITAATGKYFSLSPTQRLQINAYDGVEKTTATIEEKALLVNGDFQTVIYLKGVAPNYTNVVPLPKRVVRGTYQLGEAEAPALLVGAGIENAIAGVLQPGSMTNYTVYLPNRQAGKFTGADALNSFTVSLTGSFAVQQEFDDKYAFTNEGFMRYMLGLAPNELSSLEIKLKPGAHAASVVAGLQKSLGQKVSVKTRYQQNQSLYAIMQMEKWVIYGILSLILVVAAFNMIGALIMLILEKQKDIAVLQAMGATRATIRRIFMASGVVLAAVGAVVGMVLAYALLLVQILFKPIKLTGGTFLVDYYPVELQWFDFALVTLTVVGIATVASWLPARKASVQLVSLK